MASEKFAVYYNPKCSTCRKAKDILDEKQIPYELIHYLETGLTRQEIEYLSQKLRQNPRHFMRSKNFAEFGITQDQRSDSEWMDILVKHPQLLERPILVSATKALIGRPAEELRQLL